MASFRAMVRPDILGTFYACKFIFLFREFSILSGLQVLCSHRHGLPIRVMIYRLHFVTPLPHSLVTAFICFICILHWVISWWRVEYEGVKSKGRCKPGSLFFSLFSFPFLSFPSFLSVLGAFPFSFCLYRRNKPI